MVSHYVDESCSTLATSKLFRGAFANPDAAAGSAEANFTYFCDPAALSTLSIEYGIRHLDSCYVDNGGNWYSQPLGLCAAFVSEGGPFYVKFWSIDASAGATSHQQYRDAACTTPQSANKTVRNNVCQPSTVPGIKSYQVLVPGAVYLAPRAESKSRDIS